MPVSVQLLHVLIGSIVPNAAGFLQGFVRISAWCKWLLHESAHNLVGHTRETRFCIHKTGRSPTKTNAMSVLTGHACLTLESINEPFKPGAGFGTTKKSDGKPAVYTETISSSQQQR